MKHAAAPLTADPDEGPPITPSIEAWRSMSRAERDAFVNLTRRILARQRSLPLVSEFDLLRQLISEARTEYESRLATAEERAQTAEERAQAAEARAEAEAAARAALEARLAKLLAERGQG